ncbi:hypothetical protein VC218_07725 [Xanthomonas nasturtii]|uniref:hypothetical protein n=1 Tax=Xanthomonas nasturtii TaxID=1843581 RepID=UPI002B23A456|nr:hypothetical protein [Xanthomonas nasturtii]MEA9578809.1 hypothetical protein [Xanthomonas nasturtii]
MKERRERRSAWRFNRRLGIALLWTALAVGIAAAANLVGIRILGGIEAWSHWLRAHAGYFFAWRLVLYGATAWGWQWMHRRLRQRDASTEAFSRLRRTEIASVLVIALLEISALNGWTPGPSVH